MGSGPVVLVEAMAAGKPVVATRVGMATDVIEDNRQRLPNRILLTYPYREGFDAGVEGANRLGREARQTFKAVGDWNRVAAKLEGVYGEAIVRRQHWRETH